MQKTTITGLEAAIAAGVIDRGTAERLLPYPTGTLPAAEAADPDDEKLRLVTGFNDIFVTIGLALFLGALFYLLASTALSLAAFAVAAAAWALAEFFTRVKRLALPSIVLLVSFTGGVYAGVTGLVSGFLLDADRAPAHLLAAALAAAAAAALHWRRFHVPITVAAGVAALGGVLVALCGAIAPGLIRDHPEAVFPPLGLAVFALAMWFDSSDLRRQTRRTDIAFWLHLLAAPLIVHPILMRTVADQSSLAAAGQVVAVFVVLAVVALIVDRRAILVSSLAYLAYAAGELLKATGLDASSFAMSALAVGAVVLMLSVAWRPLRRAFIGMLPDGVRRRVPAVAGG